MYTILNGHTGFTVAGNTWTRFTQYIHMYLSDTLGINIQYSHPYPPLLSNLSIAYDRRFSLIELSLDGARLLQPPPPPTHMLTTTTATHHHHHHLPVSIHGKQACTQRHAQQVPVWLLCTNYWQYQPAAPEHWL